MVLYDLLVKDDNYVIPEKGCIWCTDGSFVRPIDYFGSGKKAYGYALTEDTAVSLTKSSETYPWSSSKDPYYSSRTSRIHDGFLGSFELRNNPEFGIDRCPAVYKCLTEYNAGKTSYMPSVRELKLLFKSIMSGWMLDDLLTAGSDVYEMCNYRSIEDPSPYIPIKPNSWDHIWSCTEDIIGLDWYNYSQVYAVNPMGVGESYDKYNNSFYYIPFYKFPKHDTIQSSDRV